MVSVEGRWRVTDPRSNNWTNNYETETILFYKIVFLFYVLLNADCRDERK